MKKLLLLGGSRYILPVIKKAHELGCYVITCDYLPDNIAHKYSDEYMNMSVIEQDKILYRAQELKIDGIMSFACDPGVVTAAYVAEEMGLPFQGSYDSVKILQDKGLFRSFLFEHGYNTPHAKSYRSAEEAMKELDYFTWPVIVKPVDAAGSKGVTKVSSFDLMPEAIRAAVKESRSSSFIIEDFLTFSGYHSSADLFTIDGELKYVNYSDQLFDTHAKNQYTPSLIIWPSTMKKDHQDYLTKETQRIMYELQMRTGIYNIETCVDIEGNPYLMEISPRGGGCKIAEIQELYNGAELIENEIRKSIGMPLIPFSEHTADGHWCEMVIHSDQKEPGRLKRISFSDEIRNKYIKSVDLAVNKGDIIMPFTGANMALGDVFLRFDSREELNEVMSQRDKWLHIELE